MRIFVQIAAYRDAELCPTLHSMFDNAADPDAISVGLCWQYADDEDLGDFAVDPRIRRVGVPAVKSRGVCWARSITQALYQGEEFTLQLDSHHRFAPGWDRTLINAYEALRLEGIEKPIITAYLPPYEPGVPQEEWSTQPLRISFGGFTQHGPWAVKSEYVEEPELSSLEPARFLSGHFLFAEGSFCKNVPYDPHLYFFGEEQSLSVRAYSHGYRFFHPLFVCCWHHYGRTAMPKHWSDDSQWWAKNERSLRRYNTLLRDAHSTTSQQTHGLGTVRSLDSYAAYTGVDAATRTVSTSALRGGPAPADDPSEPEARPYSALRVPVDARDFALDGERLSFVYVGAHDDQGRELFRHDLTGGQLKTALRDGYVDLDFEASSRYVSWTVWPHAEKLGWLEAKRIPVYW
ncbi:MAG: GlcNAc-transferase family protein [Congregibacter sp.]